MLIDTHCHYNLDPLFSEDGGWKVHWQKAQERGVKYSVVVGTDLVTSERAVSLASEEKNFGCAVGIHPHIVADGLKENNTIEPRLTATKIDELTNELTKQLASAVPTGKVMAVGETGLDFFRVDLQNSDYNNLVVLQQQLFINQIEIANNYNLPLILHVRDTSEFAYRRTLELVRMHKSTSLPFVLHCVSGPTDYVVEALKLGAYIGVAGNVTYKNAQQIHQIVRNCPKDRLLLETDAPYLPPTPHRGEICQPWMIQLTAQTLFEQFQVNPEQLAANTWTVFPSLQKL